MPYYCTVPRCTSMAGKARDVSFHQFPRDASLAAHWNLVLKRGKPYTKYSKVCSRHFTPQDYTCTTVGKNKGHWRTLRKDAVPTQNLPGDSPVPYRSQAPRSRSDSSDHQIQQQLAHAVYVQTMLAVHAANMAAAQPGQPAGNACDVSPAEDDSRDSSEPGDIQTDSAEPPELPSDWDVTDVVRVELGTLRPEVTRAGWYSDNDSKPEIQKPKRPLPTVNANFKCEDCSKCFKDPDVFLLHKRWHMNGAPGQEKPPDELMGKLLQPVNSESDTAPAFDPLNLEHHILMAMRVNMQNYIKTMVGNQVRGHRQEEQDPIGGQSSDSDGSSEVRIKDECMQE